MLIYNWNQIHSCVLTGYSTWSVIELMHCSATDQDIHFRLNCFKVLWCDYFMPGCWHRKNHQYDPDTSETLCCRPGSFSLLRNLLIVACALCLYDIKKLDCAVKLCFYNKLKCVSIYMSLWQKVLLLNLGLFGFSYLFSSYYSYTKLWLLLFSMHWWVVKVKIGSFGHQEED